MKNKLTLSSICIGLCLAYQLCISHLFSQTVIIDPNTEHQIIQGFGGMNHTSWRPDLNDDARQKAFGNKPGEIGLSILRIQVDPDSNTFYRSVPTALFAHQHGAKIFATPWNAPSRMAENFTINNETHNRVMYDKYGEYAGHLNQFYDFMNDSGVPLYAISVQNEPDYGEWTRWTSAEMVTFMKNNAHVLKTRVMAPESFQFRRNFTDPILNDDQANANLDIVGGHIYGGGLFDYPLAREKGKEVWMTEHLLGSNAGDVNDWNLALVVAKEINDCMKSNFNAYVWWYIQRFYGLIDQGGNITDKGYVMSHFSKFIRPGAIRIGDTVESATNIEITAYKTDTSLIIVALNLNSEDVALEFNFQNIGIDTLTRFTSTATKRIVNEGGVEIVNNTFNTTLEARSITTFTTHAKDGGKYGNILPIANAGTDQVIYDNDKNGIETITLNASESIDTDGEIVNYSWSANGEHLSTDSILTMDMDIGEYEFILTIIDDDGAPAVDTVNITIISLTNTNIWLEAECTPAGSNWNILADENASNGVYVTVNAGTESTGAPSSNTDDILTYTFYINEASYFKVWARTITPSANDDSYWVRMDDNPVWYNWNSIPGSTSWNWDDVHDAAPENNVLFNLDTGYHTLFICYREDGALLDKILITNTGLQPDDVGGDANNCSGNLFPIANAGTDQNITNASGSGSEKVTLDGSLSSDSDGKILAYVWLEDDTEIASGANPDIELETGDYEIVLKVIDDKGGIDYDTVLVNIYPIDYITANSNYTGINYTVYPNPFTDNISVSYSLDKGNHIKIELINIIGISTYTLINEYINEGNYSLTINGDNINKGIYCLRIVVGNDHQKCSIVIKN